MNMIDIEKAGMQEYVMADGKAGYYKSAQTYVLKKYKEVKQAQDRDQINSCHVHVAMAKK